MKKIKVVFLTALLALWIQPAMGYIDPGSGSAIMSAIIGFFVAVSLGVKTYWYKLKGMFSSSSNEQKTPEESKQQP